jgi:hypothetical protein
MAIPTIPQQAADQVMAELGLTDDALAVANAADASMDPTSALGATAEADFNNAELNSALDQAMNANAGAGQNIADIAGGSGTMAGDANNIFGDLDLDMTQAPQMLNPDGSNAAMSQNAEEDIFAGLDMNLGDDFNFS